MNDTKVMNLAADNIRILAASMVEKAKSGHPGGAMGGADFINVLYSEYAGRKHAILSQQTKMEGGRSHCLPVRPEVHTQ